MFKNKFSLTKFLLFFTLLINILLSAMYSFAATAGAMTMNKATIKTNSNKTQQKNNE